MPNHITLKESNFTIRKINDDYFELVLPFTKKDNPDLEVYVKSIKAQIIDNGIIAEEFRILSKFGYMDKTLPGITKELRSIIKQKESKK